MRIARLLLLSISLCLLAAASASASIIVFDNGPINGNVNAWGINFSSVVANSFSLSSAGTITGVNLGIWVFSSDVPLQLDWQITSDPFSGLLRGEPVTPTTASLTNTFLFTNDFFYDVYSSKFQITGVTLPAGDYWLELSSGVTTGSSFMFWDENDGLLSSAYVNDIDQPIGSESFSISTPEPGILALLGCGVLLVGLFYRKTH